MRLWFSRCNEISANGIVADADHAPLGAVANKVISDALTRSCALAFNSPSDRNAIS
jgi:hypothetical protein